MATTSIDKRKSSRERSLLKEDQIGKVVKIISLSNAHIFPNHNSHILDIRSGSNSFVAIGQAGRQLSHPMFVIEGVLL